MFTGIVQALQPITAVGELVGGRRLAVSLGPVGDALAQHVELGASIAINGTCLTVASMGPDSAGDFIVEFDVMQETLEKTNLGQVQVGSKVNVERSLKFGDELGGHVVSGHVDTTAKITKVERTENNCKVHFEFDHPQLWVKYIVPKGYITIDGTSLTVVDVHSTGLTVCLIPETLARTTVGVKQEGDLVNIELDNQTKVLVRTLENMLPHFISDYMAKNSAH